MESAIVGINLFGAVALLLYGLAQVKDGMSRAWGARLRTGLAAGTRGGLRSFAAGFVATVALQSSTATALMVASFVEKELIAPAMAQVVLLGANVGTAPRPGSWRSASAGCRRCLFSPELPSDERGPRAQRCRQRCRWHRPHAVVIASARKRDRSASAVAGTRRLPRDARQCLAGGFVLRRRTCGSRLLQSRHRGAHPVAGLCGRHFTALVVVLVLGANLGGAVPPVLATLGASAGARRVTIGNLIVRAIGCVIALPLAGYCAEFMELARLSPQKLAVDAHLLFNLAVAMIAFPVSPLLYRLTASLIPQETESDIGPRYLDMEALARPVAALAGAGREVMAVGDLIEGMLVRALDALKGNDLSMLADISMLEGRVDRIQHEIKLYVSRVGKDDMTEDDHRRARHIVDYAINLEHIGDIIEKGLHPEIAKKISLGLRFSGTVRANS